MPEYVARCEQCGPIESGDLEDVGDAVEDHEQFHDVDIQPVATDGGPAHAGGAASPPETYTPDAARQLAGVGDQDPETCENGTIGCPGSGAGLEQCFDCFLGGESDE